MTKGKLPYIVALGASAGGLAAIQYFFDTIPMDSGLAFIVIQHLAPNFKSLMSEILIKNTKMPIFPVENAMPIKPNTVYLLPSNQNMVIKDGRLFLTNQHHKNTLNLPINIFFKSLATECGKKAIGIVLSGTGSDGSQGVIDLHKSGALTIAQNTESAKFDAMPRNAIATNCVDCILDIEQMSDALLAYLKQPKNFRAIYCEAEKQACWTPNEKIFSLLLKRYKHDFNLYKPTTIFRRIERRMTALGLQKIDAYAEALENDNAELDTLYNDLLIGVTAFFRDPEAFDILQKQVIPKIAERRANGIDEARIWVPACATGEEAYSIAILFHEYCTKNSLDIAVKIFATDVSKHFLEIAGQGVYAIEQMEGLSKKRQDTYFSLLSDGRYQIIPAIRNMIIFATHNVIVDPPFTKLDLISCRNFLIYVQPTVQKKIINFFRFALLLHGYLFLGHSETAGSLGKELIPISTTWKIFEKILDVRHGISFTPSVHMTVPAIRPSALSAYSSLPSSTLSGTVPLHAYDLLLNHIMQNGILIDDTRTIVHIFGNATQYLSLPSGRLSLDIISIIHPQLKVILSTALQKSAHNKKDLHYVDIELSLENKKQLITLMVSPLLNEKNHVQYYLIQINPQGDNKINPSIETYYHPEESSKILEDLEKELQQTRESLHATIEEVETTNEELQSTNEELLASNEELIASNKELQLVNEELHAVNTELQQKIKDLTLANNDIDNFVRSTHIGTVFVDTKLMIWRFTPAIAEIFDLVPSDTGRSLKIFKQKIQFNDLIPQIKKTIETGKSFNQEVKTNDNKWFLMRILPYLSENNTREGAILTFIDIDATKKISEKVAINESRFRALVEAASNIVWSASPDGKFQNDQAAWRVFTGQTLKQMSGLGWLNAVKKEDRSACIKKWKNCMKTKKHFFAEVQLWRKEKQSNHHVILHGVPLMDHDGHILEWIGSLTDVDKEKRADQLLKKLNIDLKHRISEKDSELLSIEEIANFDAITHLPNRNSFMTELQHAIAKTKRSKLQLALLYLDFDNFKKINDTFGHPTGDKFLQAVSERIKKELREIDFFARIGGDEFVILIEDSSVLSEAQRVALRILGSLKKTLTIDKHKIKPSISIGISLFTNNDNVDTLLKRADLAMYQAKALGKNTFQFYSKEIKSTQKNKK